MLPGNTALEDNLTNMLRPILTMNPTTFTPFDLIPVVNALNICLPQQNMFNVGNQQCAGEFLDSLLSSLTLGPYISSFEEIGICPLCNTPQLSTFNTNSQFLLLLPLAQHVAQPVDLFTEVGQVLTGQFFSLTCLNVGCAGFQSRIHTQVQCTERTLTIFWTGRNTAGNGAKSLRQVAEPPANTSLWRGKDCVAVIAHSGRSAVGGHWFTFLKIGGAWWRSDTSLPRPLMQNPFNDQLLESNQSSSSDFTVDIMFFQ